MTQISAANNILIEIEPERWRLLLSNGSVQRTLVDAAADKPLSYATSFGETRRLPDEGRLTPEQIQRVVVGWSSEDTSWHLGLILGPELAAIRGSRWCEMARWYDPEAQVYDHAARDAGQALADTINRPFAMIPPKTSAAPVPAPPPPLPALPLEVGIWTVDEAADKLQFTRTPRWARSKAIRALWYTMWVVIYIILAVTTLRSGIALPRPEFLPYLGLASAVILVGMIGYLVYQLVSKPNRILVDDKSRTVSGLLGGGERWRIGADDVDSVYVTQVVSKPSSKFEPGKGRGRTVNHSELNLFLRDGKFIPLVIVPYQIEQKTYDSDDPTKYGLEDAAYYIEPLTPDQVFTDVQAAGMYVARALGVPCRYDRRLK